MSPASNRTRSSPSRSSPHPSAPLSTSAIVQRLRRLRCDVRARWRWAARRSGWPGVEVDPRRTLVRRLRQRRQQKVLRLARHPPQHRRPNGFDGTKAIQLFSRRLALSDTAEIILPSLNICTSMISPFQSSQSIGSQPSQLAKSLARSPVCPSCLPPTPRLRNDETDQLSVWPLSRSPAGLASPRLCG